MGVFGAAARSSGKAGGPAWVSGLSVAGNFASCSPLYACSTFPHTRPSNIKSTGSRSASTTSSQTFQTPSRPSLSLARLPFLRPRPRPRVPGARRTRCTRCTSTLVLHRASLRCSACCLAACRRHYCHCCQCHPARFVRPVSKVSTACFSACARACAFATCLLCACRPPPLHFELAYPFHLDSGPLCYCRARPRSAAAACPLPDRRPPPAWPAFFSRRASCSFTALAVLAPSHPLDFARHRLPPHQRLLTPFRSDSVQAPYDLFRRSSVPRDSPRPRLVRSRRLPFSIPARCT